eukprot:6194509-Pleurochrysis_carterae.AAC.3
MSTWMCARQHNSTVAEGRASGHAVSCKSCQLCNERAAEQVVQRVLRSAMSADVGRGRISPRRRRRDAVRRDEH